MAENTTTPLLGAPFDQGVRQQIQVRKKYRSKARKGDADLAEQYSKTAFIRVSSGVIIDGDSDIARKNVLQGGILNEEGNQREGINYIDNTTSTYTFSEALGYRPMPGIKDVVVQSQNTEGTVRKTDLGFTVNSLEQLETMERLYLRPGYSVLIEFGNTIYHDNNENLVTDIPILSEFLNDSTNKAEDVEIAIQRLKEESDYNYDAIFGVCMNFQYSYNEQGAYDCTMYVMSKGTLLESIKTITQGKASKAKNLDSADALTSAIVSNRKDPEKSTSDNLSPAAEVFSKMYSIVGSQDNLFDLLNNAYPTFGFTETDVPLYLHNVNSRRRKNKMVYIKFSTLMKILNNTLNLVANDNENFFTLSSNRLVDSRFVTYDNHFSSNPGVALLPKKPNDQTLWFGAGNPTIFAGQSDQINNILINVVYLNDLMSSLSKESKEDTTLVDFIKTVCADVGKALGGYNNFDLHYVEEDNTFYIVDRMMTPVGGAPRQNVIPCIGDESLLTNLAVTSKITNEIASMIAIGAAAGGQNLGSAAGTLLTVNKGLVDKFKADLSQAASEDDSIDEVDTETYEDQLEDIRKVVRKFVVQRQFKQSECEDIAEIHNAIMSSDMAKGSNPQQGTLPFECSFEMDGIGGIRIGQAFVLQPGILPSYVQARAGFIVKSLNHSIQGNKWSTEISAYMFMLEPDETKATKNFGTAELSASDQEKINNFNGLEA